MIAYYVHDLNPFLLRFGDGWGLRWYGLAYLAAFFIGYLVYRQLAYRGFSQLRPDQVGDFIFGGALFGVILGGRLGYMLFYNLNDFLANPLIFFRLHEGGMSAHGGIIGLALYSLWFARKHHVSWLNIGDNLVVVAPVGLFLGRAANFINGELYGRPTTVAWAVQFPKELYDAPPEKVQLAIANAEALNPAFISIEAIVEGVRHSPELHELMAATLSPRHPSQIYEAILEGGLLFAILWILRTRFRLPDGMLTGIFFIGYAVFRSICEIYREPDSPLVGSLTRGQFLSLFLVAIGICFVAASLLKRGADRGSSPAKPSGGR